jgi:competence protein ComGC
MNMNRTTKSFIALTCIAVLCVIAIPAIIAVPDGFLTANTTSQITVMGCNATYLLTIENTGAETDIYDLTTTNIDDASVVVLNQSAITLDAGCSGNLTLNVTDDDIIGPYCVIVNATSRTNAEVTDDIEIITAVVEE